MFVPFSSKKPGGSGLGLAIAQRIVDEHGGVLIPEFDLERGVRFNLWIPDVQRA
jgi:nitrogen-specific signal transduction histidine kinase